MNNYFQNTKYIVKLLESTNKSPKEIIREIHSSTCLLHLTFEDIILINTAVQSIDCTNITDDSKNDDNIADDSKNDNNIVDDSKNDNLNKKLDILEYYFNTDNNKDNIISFIKNILDFKYNEEITLDSDNLSNSSVVLNSNNTDELILHSSDNITTINNSTVFKNSSKKKGKGKNSHLNTKLEYIERIVKKKKSKRYYKDMDQKSKDIDNQYDYCVQCAYYDNNTPRIDELDVPVKTPYILDFYSEMDIEFRRIILKIINFNKQNAKDKDYNAELAFLEEYFEKTLNLKKLETGSRGRLNNTIANLMKQLQHRMFDMEYSGEVKSKEEYNIFHFVKNRLYMFYNHYRK